MYTARLILHWAALGWLVPALSLAASSSVHLEADSTFEFTEFLLTGSAQDEDGIGLVTVAIQDQDTGLWLQRDDSWGVAPARLGVNVSAPGSQTTAWLFRQSLPIGAYQVDSEATDLLGEVESAAGRVVHAFSIVSDRPNLDPGLRWLTIFFGRSQWGVAGAGGETCAPYADPNNGTVFLDEVAAFLSNYGFAAEASVPFGYISDDPAVRNCPFRAIQHASLNDMTMLRDEYGWTFVADSIGALPSNPTADRPGMSTLSCEDQITAASASLAELSRLGHQRGWGVMAAPNGYTTPEIRDDITSRMYAFTRAYGNLTQTEITQEKALSRDWGFFKSVRGGLCNDPDAPCYDQNVTDQVDIRYSPPEEIFPYFVASPGNWRSIQFYRFVRGSYLPEDYPGSSSSPAGSTRETYWDCTSPDPNQHWTSRGEVYCYNDFVSMIERVRQDYPDVVTTNSAHVATTWGLGNPNHWATYPTCAGNAAPVASNVAISGTAEIGQTLSGSYTYSDADGDPEGTSTFRWLRDGIAIIDATAPTYLLVTADLGAQISFEVTPVAQGGVLTGTPVESTPTAAVVAANSAPVASNVAISGTAEIGQTLSGSYTYSDADGDPEGTSTFRWLRDGVAIDGATAQTYLLVAADLGTQITFEVTPVAQSGVAIGVPLTSAPTDQVVAVSPTSAPVASNVAISGSAEVGQTLGGSYTYSDADGDPEGTSTFRWLRNGVAIDGATAPTYLLVAADLGAQISFEVTPVAQSGVLTGTPVASAPTAAVVAANSAPVASNVAISGTAEVGQTLSGSYTYSDSDSDPEGTSTFRWLRNGVAIDGATAPTYLLVAADLGAQIGFEVTPVARSGITTGSPVASAPTAAVDDGQGKTAEQLPISIAAAGARSARAANMIDTWPDGEQNLTSSWKNDQTLATAWFTMDLGTSTQLERISIAPRGDWVYVLTVRVGDSLSSGRVSGGSVSTCQTSGADSATPTFLEDCMVSAKGRYVTVESNRRTFRVHGLEAYGYEPVQVSRLPATVHAVGAKPQKASSIVDELVGGEQDLSTNWINDGSLSTAWFTLDVGSTSQINKLSLALRGDLRHVVTIRVGDTLSNNQVSDGTDVSCQMSGADSNTPTYLQDCSISRDGRYITVFGDRDWLKVYGAEVYGN